MTGRITRHLTIVSLLSTTFLGGCVVWQSDYDKLQAQNQQLQQQVATDQQQISRLQGAIKYTVNSDLLFAPGSWQMRPQGQQVIANLAKKLTPTQQNHLVASGEARSCSAKGFGDSGPVSSNDTAQGRAKSACRVVLCWVE